MYNILQHSDIINSNIKQSNTLESTKINNTSVTPLQQVLQQHLPLLKLLDKQPRWQLWLSSRLMLDRNAIVSSGLCNKKIIYLPYLENSKFFLTIKNAILSKNYSYIVACSHAFSSENLEYLQHLANEHGTVLFIVGEQLMEKNDFYNLLKITRHYH